MSYSVLTEEDVMCQCSAKEWDSCRNSICIPHGDSASCTSPGMSWTVDSDAYALKQAYIMESKHRFSWRGLDRGRTHVDLKVKTTLAPVQSCVYRFYCVN